MSKYIERAKEIRAIEVPHYNCAQSILLTFCKDAGVSEELAMKMGAHFGGGMKNGSVCGVITGALMVFGLFGLEEPVYAQNTFKFFKEKHDDVLMCGELLKINAEKGGQRKPHCDALVYEMVEYIEEVLKENGKL